MENNQQTELSKKERKDLRRTERLKEEQKLARRRIMERVTKIALAVIIIGGGLGGFIWYLASRPPIPEGEIISRNGLHWHPELTITIKGERHEIPTNIGIGIVHQPIHTHDSTGVIHLEIQGLVRKENIKLGQFFKIWDKEFSSNCIFDKCSGPEGVVRMLANGSENREFENYVMKDGDKIEIRYE